MDVELQNGRMNGGCAREEFSKLNSYITTVCKTFSLMIQFLVLYGWNNEWRCLLLLQPRWKGLMGKCDGGCHTGGGQHGPLKCGHWWTHGPFFHHDGLFLCSVLWLGYLAEVDTAAFSTDPYFGWPPLHCLVAIQVVWDRVWRHQWSWEGQGERRGRRGESVMDTA